MSKHFVRFANRVAWASGYPSVFAVAVLMVLVWLATGPIFHFSDTWQLVMNTLTSVITFLVVFLIQTSKTGTAPPFKQNSMNLSVRAVRKICLLGWSNPRKSRKSGKRSMGISKNAGRPRADSAAY
jgi:low affinity Fe/Cu permease